MRGALSPCRRAIISTAALTTAATATDDGVRAGRATLATFVDEFCSTDPHPRVPLPPPWPRVDVRPNALDLVIAAGQLHAAANAMGDHPLTGDLSAGADRLLDVALRRLAR